MIEIILTKQKENKYFSFWPENKTSPQDKFSDHLKVMKPDKITQNKKLTCDWTEKRKNEFRIGCWILLLDIEKKEFIEFIR